MNDGGIFKTYIGCGVHIEPVLKSFVNGWEYGHVEYMRFDSTDLTLSIGNDLFMFVDVIELSREDRLKSIKHFIETHDVGFVFIYSPEELERSEKVINALSHIESVKKSVFPAVLLRKESELLATLELFSHYMCGFSLSCLCITEFFGIFEDAVIVKSEQKQFTCSTALADIVESMIQRQVQIHDGGLLRLSGVVITLFGSIDMDFEELVLCTEPFLNMELDITCMHSNLMPTEEKGIHLFLAYKDTE